MVWQDLTPDKIMSRESTMNAVTVAMATGCSTNAIIHLIAMARRAGMDLRLDDLDAIGRTTPVIANIRPSGNDYLMEDFFYAGGLPALMVALGNKLDLSVTTVTGSSLGACIDGACSCQMGVSGCRMAFRCVATQSPRNTHLYSDVNSGTKRRPRDHYYDHNS